MRSGGEASSNPNPFDPVDVARASPYFRRNHIGKVTCTLCNIYCNDEHAFIKHLAGKTHSLEIGRLEQQELRKQRLSEEDRLNEVAAQRARANQLLLQQAAKLGKSSRAPLPAASITATPNIHGGGGGGLNGNAGGSGHLPEGGGGGGRGGLLAVQGQYGVPVYSFRTEHDARGRQTRVWLTFHFANAEEGTRPLHRWLSAREQAVEKAPPGEDADYFVYLLVACEGYTTAAIKFPAKATRTQEGDPRGAEAYQCSWDPLQKTYSLFFVMSR
ncbi:unnamed protein product [Phytomonas sp. EM1]|nr:unnamed protein product [Phytomonas sp. EM1]|eukprot:CCW65881.1 unnamed protein product [Phytomonas sp. isolate EM1]